MSPEELEEILQAHRKWLESGGREGRRAELRATGLSGVDLRNANLSRADLQEADLSNAALDEANLSEATVFDANLTKAALHTADLTGADLRGANLQEARLIKTKLRETQLQGAKLATAVGLLSSQFAGSDVSGAKLPEDIAKFEGLAHVEETSRNTRKIFLATLLGCVYSWLTIATTTDARLLTNSASSPLPIIRTEVPIAGFYWAAPIILLNLYFYLHLYLQRLWEGLAKLPAVFPDGRALHERAYPWLLNGLVRAHLGRLKGGRTLFSRFEYIVSVALAWWVIPFTLLLFWGRYLPRHEWLATGLHVGLLVVSVGGAIMLHRHAVRTLRGRPTKFRWKEPWMDARSYQGAAALAIGAIFALVSLGAIEGTPRERIWHPYPYTEGPQTWVPMAFEFIGYRAFADLREAHVSTRPENWWMAGDGQDKLEAIQGASLRHSDLRYVDALGAFLAKADLRFANLQGAILIEANLEHADLSGADLGEGLLTRANLQEADLIDADLQGANLIEANLEQATLVRAGLQEADLSGANLQGADLRFADLQDANFAVLRPFVWISAADLSDADLSTARGLVQNQLDRACGNEKTKLPEGLTIEPCPEEQGAE
ncbi:MAG: pentapeptide repeat-containing protein [Dehalococcoidia bacterium]